LSAEALSASWPAGVARQLVDEIDSTSVEAERRARRGVSGPEWIIARRQTAGHGRRGRAWLSPEGNFAASLLMHVREAPARMALRSFVAALALHEALASALGRADALALKWPNDVLLHGGKVAGILLEAPGQRGVAQRIIIGIGVNLVRAPRPAALEPGCFPPVSLLAETGVRIAPEAFLDLLAPAYARREAQFCAHGFAPIRAAWLARAAHLGEPISARTGSETLTGTFKTVDEAGALVLSSPEGRRAISAAEVFFGG